MLTDVLQIEITKAGIIHVAITERGEKLLRSLLDKPKVERPEGTGQIDEQEF